jgi:hypothetical protein
MFTFSNVSICCAGYVSEIIENNAKGWMKKSVIWARSHMALSRSLISRSRSDVGPKSPAAGDHAKDAPPLERTQTKSEAKPAEAELTFGQMMKKHFFEDMRLMYVSTTGALLKSLRCTPVGNRDLQKFWLSDAWFGNSVLSADPEQVCWEGQHAQLAPYFVVMLLLYAIGYPVAVFVVLRRASNPLEREGWHPKVRLYTLNAVYPYILKAPGFNP